MPDEESIEGKLESPEEQISRLLDSFNCLQKKVEDGAYSNVSGKPVRLEVGEGDRICVENDNGKDILFSFNSDGMNVTPTYAGVDAGFVLQFDLDDGTQYKAQVDQYIQGTKTKLNCSGEYYRNVWAKNELLNLAISYRSFEIERLCKKAQHLLMKKNKRSTDHSTIIGK